MRALLQRVSSASVTVAGEVIARIGRGYVVLIGIAASDTETEVAFLSEKVASLRLFEDLQGRTNLSIQDVGGEALVVSQFTLYAETRKGRRPSFINAAPPERAEPLVNRFAESLRALGVPTRTGSFGAHMLVELENDGPFTILLEK